MIQQLGVKHPLVICADLHTFGGAARKMKGDKLAANQPQLLCGI